MPNQSLQASFVLGLSVLITSHAHAQWSDNSTQHQVVADGAGEQVQPKIVPTTDGGCYISWYSSNSGYDVRLQRLDSSGQEMWAHNGLLIADRNFSSTQDYDLAVDASGHAVLVYRDDQFGGTKVSAQRISPDGTMTWGANGIQFGNGVDFVASPDIATTSEGDTVIAWIGAAGTHLAKIDTDGLVVWTTSITDPGGQTIFLASMHGSDNDSVIVSWVQFASFSGPKHIYAQKLDSSGSEMWNPSVVFDGGSVQNGNFPEFVSDGSGGAVFSWYDTANGLNVFVQHLNADGSERYAHNGVVVSTFPNERVAPSVNYDAPTDSVYASWIELANNQGDRGIYAQRLDSTGSRLWGERGIAISPLDSNDSSSVNVQIVDGNMTTLWIENTGGFGLDQIHAHALTTDGNDAWEDGTVILASDLAQRGRLTTTLSSDGFAIGAWQIGDFGDADIETHNINADGSLGVSSCPADLTGDGNLNFFDVSAFLNAFSAMDPAADFTGDGQYNFFDVSAFLNAFTQGCP